MSTFSFTINDKHNNSTIMVKNIDGETSLQILKTHYKYLNSTIQMIENGEEYTIYHNMPHPDPDNEPENPFGTKYVHTELDEKDENYYRLALTRLALLRDYDYYN